MGDRARVEELLGRPPRGRFEVVVRDDEGDPVVVRNEPLLDDGTPMPTRYYLVGRHLVREVSRLESAGGVRDAERAIGHDLIAEVHSRYATERDAAIPAGHAGPRPSGGVGGTRVGVKCLHAHVAHELVGGDDPVGRWALARIDAAPGGHSSDDEEPARTEPSGGAEPGGRVGLDVAVLTIEISDRSLRIETTSGRSDQRRPDERRSYELPIGPLTMLDDDLVDVRLGGLPTPASLTNALGAVHDHLDDVLIDAPEMSSPSAVELRGHHALSLARVEHGAHDLPADYRLSRASADEVFRTVVGELRSERVHNPGLDAAHVDTIIPTCCITLGVMRRLELAQVAIAQVEVRHVAIAQVAVGHDVDETRRSSGTAG
jgi:hypothetical protein